MVGGGQALKGLPSTPSVIVLVNERDQFQETWLANKHITLSVGPLSPFTKQGSHILDPVLGQAVTLL